MVRLQIESTFHPAFTNLSYRASPKRGLSIAIAIAITTTITIVIIIIMIATAITITIITLGLNNWQWIIKIGEAFQCL